MERHHSLRPFCRDLHTVTERAAVTRFCRRGDAGQDQGGVVFPVVGQRLEDRVADPGERALLPVQVRAQRLDTLVHGAAAGLDHPVGVQRQQGPGREAEVDLAEDDGAEAQRQAGRQVRDPGRAAGQGQDGGRMPGPGDGDVLGGRVDHRVYAGREHSERCVPQRGGVAVQPAEHLRRGEIQVDASPGSVSRS